MRNAPHVACDQIAQGEVSGLGINCGEPFAVSRWRAELAGAGGSPRRAGIGGDDRGRTRQLEKPQPAPHANEYTIASGLREEIQTRRPGVF